MSELSNQTVRPSKRKQGTEIPIRSPKTKFGLVARTLWPRKTAAELAHRANVSDRAAKFWLSGKRLPSHEVLMVVLREIDGRN